MDQATFLARYPEFATASSALLIATLNEAAGRLDSAVFGSRYDEAHGALTAHSLWSSAFGVTLRLDGESSDTSKYKQHFDRIVREVSVPRRMMVI